MVTLTVVSIDAWRDSGGGWSWNDMHRAGEIELDLSASTRTILRAFREAGFLSERSKGRVRVDRAGSDPDVLEIQDRGTCEPLFAVSFSYEGDGVRDVYGDRDA